MAFTFTDQNVDEIIASGKPVVIDFWATWCGPCMRLSPIIDELAEQFGDAVVIGKYNVDEESDLSTKYRIMSIPTILFFKNGEKTDIRLAGSQSKATLEEKINETLGRQIAQANLDKVILVGDTLVGAVKSGYALAGGEAAKLSVVKTLDLAQEELSKWIKAGDCVLFMNDLPDVYIP